MIEYSWCAPMEHGGDALGHGCNAGVGLKDAPRKSRCEARTDADCYELVGDDNGVFGCMSLLACHDVCPKQLPLATQIAFVRRKMAAVGLK